ncbi:MAG TPA: hypothetical protein VFT64_11860 [Rickettsiales bacterium]|nr:hypothetical protein [Rickettsiales bacterium]
MKYKIFLAVTACYLFSCSVAAAQMNKAAPPVIIAPAPVYVSPYPSYYDPGHRRHDFEYWQRQRSSRHHLPADRDGSGQQERGEYEHRR